MLFRVEDKLKSFHSRLEAHDCCYYFADYAPESKWRTSAGSLIWNLKKNRAESSDFEMQKKAEAVVEMASWISKLMLSWDVSNYVFIPAPPSKMKGDVKHDDRLVQVLASVTPRLDFREIISLTQNKPSQHGTNGNVISRRLTPQEMVQLMSVDVSKCQNLHGKTLVIFDDVLTTVSTYKACRMALESHIPQGTINGIIGLFLARSKRDIEPDTTVFAGIPSPT